MVGPATAPGHAPAAARLDAEIDEMRIEARGDCQERVAEQPSCTVQLCPPLSQ